MKKNVSGKKMGFTLIELLVVISIIALLLSILMPALSRVKQSARNLLCGANLKQIGYYIPLYQADNDGYVPVMGHKYNTYGFAKWSYLSVALRNYIDGARPLPDYMDDLENPTESKWPLNSNRYKTYVKSYMPEFFACPLSTGKKGEYQWIDDGYVDISGVSVRKRKVLGIDEGYSTWLWPNVKGDEIFYGGHPLGGDHGYFKHGTLNWYAGPYTKATARQFAEDDINVLKSIKPTKLSSSQGKGGTLADTTILYCDRGEFLVRYNTEVYYNNYDSHSKGKGGGTFVLFGDFHVGWVEGSKIGI